MSFKFSPSLSVSGLKAKRCNSDIADVTKKATLMVKAGRKAVDAPDAVNIPVSRTSTMIYPSLTSYNGRAAGERKYYGLRYGAFGNANSMALAEAVARLDGAHGGVATSSGLSAITIALQALVSGGDHILVADTVYGPTRTFCDEVLRRFKVEVTYFNPLTGAEISSLFKANTKLVFCESPGSITFEVQDLDAISAAAHARGILVAADNSWATPTLFQPLDHGADLAIQSGSKYISGHSDAVVGIITARTDELFRKIKDMQMSCGDSAGPDASFLALRGLRTLDVRMQRHGESAAAIAQWLSARQEVKSVLYPALSNSPGHAVWKRDFTGASGLFSVVLHETRESAVANMIDGYRQFRIGGGWGGFESLVIPSYPGRSRSAVPWTEKGFVLRFHIGLEDPRDLITDLEEGFSRLKF